MSNKMEEIDKHTHVYSAVERAILRLNSWLGSLEDSLEKFDVSDLLDTKANERNSIQLSIIQRKLNDNSNHLYRIVKICEDLTNKDINKSQLNLINEYVDFVSDRYEKLRNKVRMNMQSTKQDVKQSDLIGLNSNDNNKTKLNWVYLKCSKTNEYKEKVGDETEERQSAAEGGLMIGSTSPLATSSNSSNYGSSRGATGKYYRHIHKSHKKNGHYGSPSQPSAFHHHTNHSVNQCYASMTVLYSDSLTSEQTTEHHLEDSDWHLINLDPSTYSWDIVQVKDVIDIENDVCDTHQLFYEMSNQVQQLSHTTTSQFLLVDSSMDPVEDAESTTSADNTPMVLLCTKDIVAYVSPLANDEGAVPPSPCLIKHMYNIVTMCKHTQFLVITHDINDNYRQYKKPSVFQQERICNEAIAVNILPQLNCPVLFIRDYRGNDCHNRIDGEWKLMNPVDALTTSESIHTGPITSELHESFSLTDHPAYIPHKISPGIRPNKPHVRVTQHSPPYIYPDALHTIKFTPLFASYKPIQPNENMIKLLNISTKIITEKPDNIDEMLYRHIMDIEQSNILKFESNYEFLSEVTFSDTMNSILMNYEWSYDYSLESTAFQRFKSSCLLLMRRVLVEGSPKYLRGRRIILDKVSQAFDWFILSNVMKLCLKLRHCTSWFNHQVNWQRMMNELAEINNYQMLSATY